MFHIKKLAEIFIGGHFAVLTKHTFSRELKRPLIYESFSVVPAIFRDFCDQPRVCVFVENLYDRCIFVWSISAGHGFQVFGDNLQFL